VAEAAPDGRSAELAALAEPIRAALEAAHQARESALQACRQVIQSCGASIRAVHRREFEAAARQAAAAEDALRRAQAALEPFPAVAHAGFLHDAEKEYAEARLTAALVHGDPLPSPAQLGVAAVAWLHGLAEAASELRRHTLDRLRAGELEAAEALLAAMDDVYGLLVTIDYPDALTAGLRRATDSFRAVLERTRGDLTVTVVQARLEAALERIIDPS
jgi:translin